MGWIEFLLVHKSRKQDRHIPQASFPWMVINSTKEKHPLFQDHKQRDAAQETSPEEIIFNLIPAAVRSAHGWGWQGAGR